MNEVVKCKSTAKLLAEQSKSMLDPQKLNKFYESFDEIINQYKTQNMFSSTAIELQNHKPFFHWVSSIIDEKDLFAPIIVDKMVNNKDLYALSLYQNLYAGTDLMPNIDEYKS